MLDFAGPELSDYLIARGARPDIHSAARLGRIEAVREFVRKDPSLVHARGGDGQLPLHFAATAEIAELLLEHGAEIDARDVDHESTAAQYMACCSTGEPSERQYRHDIVKLLIARGAKTDILMAAAIGDLAETERILNNDPETIRIAANERDFPKVDPRSGGCIYIFGFGVTKSPHMIAHEFGHREVFELLMQRSAPWLRLVQAAELGDAALADSIARDHPTWRERLTPRAARRTGSRIRPRDSPSRQCQARAGRGP